MAWKTTNPHNRQDFCAWRINTIFTSQAATQWQIARMVKASLVQSGRRLAK